MKICGKTELFVQICSTLANQRMCQQDIKIVYFFAHGHILYVITSLCTNYTVIDIYSIFRPYVFLRLPCLIGAAGNSSIS